MDYLSATNTLNNVAKVPWSCSKRMDWIVKPLNYLCVYNAFIWAAKQILTICRHVRLE